MKPLYELTAEYRALELAAEEYCQDSGGEIPPELDIMINQLKDQRESKALSIALWIKNLENYAEQIHCEERKLTARRRTQSALAERLREILLTNIAPGEKLKDPRAELTWRKSTYCDVYGDVPDQYCDLIRKPRVADITLDLKNGATLPFAELKERNNLQIK